MVDSLEKIKEEDPIVKSEFEEKNIKSSDFAKKLMGQIVFIYFIQKKGWMGVENKQWGTGSYTFMREIFNQSLENEENFFNDVLEPLFYKGLSEEVSDYHYSEFGYQVPFLNGGLFEPVNNYDWKKTDITLDNSIFKEIFDTFDKFNFTIKEDEPLEKEVAVDPEMLGKVFENLLEVKDRKSKGAFYTPRQIVHDMCQNSLISYLESNSNISKEDLNIFIKEGHLAIDSIIRINEQKKKYNGNYYDQIELPDSIKENSDELDELLKKVKVVDPAVGSGAFPVGMMNEIINARYILRLLNDYDFEMYELKKETISNSLYGVDLESSATDITKLRFWLSLIVDEEAKDGIKPLPNLDTHIMSGNSLIDSYKNIKLFDDSLILRSPQRTLSITPTEKIFQDIEKYKKQYFNTNGPNKKKELKNKINDLKWEFIKQYLIKIDKKELFDEIKECKDINLKPFVWELEFSEIFVGKNPGFDIVIGNPPYVRQEKINDIKPILKEQFSTYKGTADLYIYFYEKGLNLLKNGGILSFITSNKYTKAGYGEKLRKFLLNNYIELYTDYNNVNIFDKVSVDSSIIQVIKKDASNNNILVDEEYFMDQKYLTENGFNFLKSYLLELKEKIMNNGKFLKNIDSLKMNRGITTGCNDVFLISGEAKNDFIMKDLKNQDIIKPVLHGRNVKKYGIHFNENDDESYVIFSRKGIDIDKYPILKNYLNQYKNDLIPRKTKERNKKGGRAWGSYKWYELQTPVNFYENFEKPKIIFPELTSELFARYDDKGFYLMDTVYLISSDDIDKLKIIRALFSSKVLIFVHKIVAATLGKSKRLKKMYVENLPIKFPNDIEITKRIVELVDILENNIRNLNNFSDNDKNTKMQEIKGYESELDQIIYDLYNLNDEDIEIIEDFLKEKDN